MRRSALGALALVIAVPAGLVGLAQPASATTVSVPSVAGFVADDVHHRVFVGNYGTGKVLATDYAGNLVDAANGIDGVTDLALNADSSVLYAASWATHEVVALDPATLNEITRYTVATTYGPRHLAFAGGKVWFSYGDQWSGNLGSIDPGTGVVTMNQFPNRVYGQALLDGAVGKPGFLAVGETGISTDSMAVLDVSGASPVQTAYYRGDYTLNEGIRDIDLVPGAAQVLVNGKERQAYDGAGTFTPAGAYPVGVNADISDTGLVAATDGNQTRVYKPGVSTAINTFVVGGGALAWSPDESKLFLLKSNDSDVYGGPFTVAVIDAPTVARPTLIVSAPSSAPRAQQLTVSGSISSGDPFAADPTLTVLREDADHPSGTALPDVQVAPDGSWSFTDTPEVGGSVTYVVSYAGDADHPAVTSQATVAVYLAPVTLTVSAPSSGPIGQQLIVSGSVTSGAPFAADPTLTILRKDGEHPSGTALPDVQAAPDGSWSFPDTPDVSGSVTYVVSYAGDADHQAASSQDTVAVPLDAVTLTLNPGSATYAYGTQVTFTAHLGSTYQNRTVEIWIDPAGADMPPVQVRSAEVDPNGDIDYTATLIRNTVVTAVYAGDSRTAAKTVSVTAKARVRLSVTVAREFKAAKIGFQGYFWFHKATSPLITTTMTPYPGRTTRLDLQLYSNGGWHSADSAFFKLTSTGKVAVSLGTPNRTGVRARVRSCYISGSSGDSVNATTVGAWTYLYWTT